MRLFTLTGFATLALVLAPRAEAQQCTGTAGTDYQEVTVREINAIPQANIDQLNAAGADVTIAQAQALLTNDLEGETVEFTAVLLTDPFKSGIRSLNAQGIPGGVHTYVRDVSAATDGNAGMGIQVVDFSGSGDLQKFFAGDEITFCGEVGVFEGSGGVAMQLDFESGSATGTTYAADDALRQPVVITTDDIHDTFDVGGDPQSQIDWSVYGDYNGQFVRFENIELLQGVSGDRPNLLLSSAGQDTEINTYDTSVCFRNDRGEDYFPTGQTPSCVSNGDFVPPPSGIVNIQGYLIFQGDDGGFDYSVPDEANFSINPFEESDFEIAVAPPILDIDDAPVAFVGSGAVVSLTAVPGTSGNTISSVVVNYTTSSGGSGEVELTNTSGDIYEGVITGLSEDDFVTYSVTATDNQNAASVSDSFYRLVLNGPVDSIADVQRTPDTSFGPSGLTSADPIAFDLDAVVQTAYQAGSRFQATVQDDASLGPFSGVLMDFGSDDPGLSVGDRITITEARVSEFRDATQLVDVTFTTTSSGDPYPAKVVSTAIFNGEDGAETAEQHEGMLLRFEDVTVTDPYPDADEGETTPDFGEFAISSDGTAANELRVDDATDAVSSDFNTTLVVDQELSLVQGYLSYSFGNYKLIPTAAGDIAYAVSVGEGPEVGAARIVAAFPNPATDAARVRFALDAPGAASLRLFDVTGREVATLAEGAFAADVHEVSADLGGLSAGVYVLRLEAEGAVASVRLAIVR